MKLKSMLVLALAAMFAFSAQATVLRGVGATKIAATPSGLSDLSQSGHKKIVYDTYVFAAAPVTGDSIKLGGLIPAGALILDATLFFDQLDSGAGAGAVRFGWVSSNTTKEDTNLNGFFGVSVVTTTATSLSMQGDYPTAGGNLKRLEAAVQPTVSITSQGTTPVTATTVSGLIEYITE